MSPWNVTILHTCDVYSCSRAALVNIATTVVVGRQARYTWHVLPSGRVVRVTLESGRQKRPGSTYLCHQHAVELDVDAAIIEGALA